MYDEMLKLSKTVVNNNIMQSETALFQKNTLKGLVDFDDFKYDE